MGRYYYPDAPDALSAKIQFLKEHHYKINHCFKNTWGTGYVLFDTKAEVNEWHKEHAGTYFYTEEYEPGTIFTEADAMREIENSYARTIDEALSLRDYTLPILAIGLPSSSAFGNRLFLKFAKSTEEEDITWRFYTHYIPRCLDVRDVNNIDVRKYLVKHLYQYFYNDRFKKRIEGSRNNKQ